MTAAHNILYAGVARRKRNHHFASPGPSGATVLIDVFVNRQINFQNKVQWLGGRISNTTSA